PRRLIGGVGIGGAGAGAALDHHLLTHPDEALHRLRRRGNAALLRTPLLRDRDLHVPAVSRHLSRYQHTPPFRSPFPTSQEPPFGLRGTSVCCSGPLWKSRNLATRRDVISVGHMVNAICA